MQGCGFHAEATPRPCFRLSLDVVDVIGSKGPRATQALTDGSDWRALYHSKLRKTHFGTPAPAPRRQGREANAGVRNPACLSTRDRHAPLVSPRRFLPRVSFRHAGRLSAKMDLSFPLANHGTRVVHCLCSEQQTSESSVRLPHGAEPGRSGSQRMKDNTPSPAQLTNWSPCKGKAIYK